MISGLGGFIGWEKEGGKQDEPLVKREKPLVVLVLQEDAYDWEEIFKGHTANGRAIRVVQTSWEHVHIIVGPVDNFARKPYVRTMSVTVTTTWKNGIPSIPPTRTITVQPDFVLIRNECVTPDTDHKAKLMGFMYANIASLNNLTTIFLNIERPVMQAALNGIQDRVGREIFPVVEQNYFPSMRGFMYTLPFPAVLKIGTAHAGMGKIKVANHHDMEDARGILPMTKHGYAFAEPFLTGAHDLRIQKIGSIVKAFKRVSISGDWKTNTGCSDIQRFEPAPEMVKWAELATFLFGEGLPMDVLTVDAVVDEAGQAHILEINGTSSGLAPEEAADDNVTIRDLVLLKLSSMS